MKGKPHVLIAETTCTEHLNKIKRFGWGRMFCQRSIKPFTGERWGFDNGAFLDWRRGVEFDAVRFEDKLAEAASAGKPWMAVTPDIVGQGAASLRRSLDWRERLDGSWPWYLAVQDGMTLDEVAAVLHLFSGVFLGGTDKFKLGAYKWCELAHAHGKPFHYARAGTLTKLRHAIRIGADSIDSAFPLWTHDRFDRFYSAWSYEEQQHELALIGMERGASVWMRSGGAGAGSLHRVLRGEGFPASALLDIRRVHRGNNHLVADACK